MKSRRLGVLTGFFRKEVAQTLRDPVMKIFLIGAPILQLTIFGYAISTEIKNIRLAALFAPPDAMARQLTERFYASGWFIPAENGITDPEKLLRSGRADAVLVAPHGGLTRAMGRGDIELQVLIDATNAVKARSIEMYARSISQRFFSEKLPQSSRPSPVFFDVRVLYNPTMRTSFYLVPGIMGMVICLVTIMTTAMSLAREKEMGTLETIIAAPLYKREIILGKIIPFVVLGMLNALLVIAVGISVFQVPLRGSLLLLLISAFVFVCCTVSIGTLISTFARNQQQAMMGSFLFIFPANLLSGLFFPVENIPPLLRFFAYIDPVKYFIDILRNIMLKGGNTEMVLISLAILTAMLFGVITLAIARFRQTLN